MLAGRFHCFRFTCLVVLYIQSKCHQKWTKMPLWRLLNLKFSFQQGIWYRIALCCAILAICHVIFSCIQKTNTFKLLPSMFMFKLYKLPTLNYALVFSIHMFIIAGWAYIEAKMIIRGGWHSLHWTGVWEFLFQLISSFLKIFLCQNFSFFFYFQPIFGILPWFHSVFPRFLHVASHTPDWINSDHWHNITQPFVLSSSLLNSINFQKNKIIFPSAR